MSAITDRLAYIEKPTAVDAKSYTHSCLPINGTTFDAGSIIRIDVPCSQYGTYLSQQESYLKLTFVNTSVASGGAGAGVYLDGSGYSLIDRLQVLYAGYTLEDVSDYGLLASIFTDNCMPLEARQTYGEMTLGTFQHTHTTNSHFTRHGATVGASGEITVFLPLISAVVGMNSDKMLPLSVMNASDSLRIELTLANAGVPVKTNASTDTGTYQVKDVEFVAQIVKLSDDAEAMVRQSVGTGKYRIHGDSFRSFNSTLDSGVNNSSVHIPIKVSSLKTLLIAHRLQASLTAKNFLSTTNRTRADLTEFYIQVGSTRIPQKPIKFDANGGEIQVELQKALHQFGRKGTQISYYKSDFVKTATSDDAGAFLVGLDMESFSGKSDVLNQGISTISQNIFFVGTYDSVPAAALITSFAHFDQVVEVDASTGLAKVMF